MRTYRTAELAAIIGIHPNTVRLYEELELIPKPERRPNGYRIFTEFHLEQFRLARLAFQIEVLQNGLRKKIVRLVKASAAGEFNTALALAQEYIKLAREERVHAENAADLAREGLCGREKESGCLRRRREVSAHLGISVDALRNWETNGLLTVKRKDNGYRVYTEEDIRRLKVIRTLRCAGYSLEAILHLLCQLSENPETDIAQALNTPRKDADIVAVCDKLITSLTLAEQNARQMIGMLKKMKQNYS